MGEQTHGFCWKCAKKKQALTKFEVFDGMDINCGFINISSTTFKEYLTLLTLAKIGQCDPAYWQS